MSDTLMSDAPPPAAQVMAEAQGDAATASATHNEAWLAFAVKYGKTSLSVRFAESDQVYELKTVRISSSFLSSHLLTLSSCRFSSP